jgi:glycosyltransferase involved in cell wall biosynthesis
MTAMPASGVSPTPARDSRPGECTRISVLELRAVRGTGGGPDKTILLGAERRHADRFDITVCYLRNVRDDEFTIDARARRLQLDYVEIRERGALDWRIWRPLVALVRDRRIDIVHAHDYKTDLLALLLQWRTGVIALATAHNWTGHSARELHLYHPIDKRLLTRFPHVVAVSSQIKDVLIRHGAAAERVTVLLNAVDPSAFRANAARRAEVRNQLGYTAADVVVGAVGRLEREKRYDLLLEAIAPLMRTFPHLRLAIVGDGRLAGALAASAGALSIGDRTRFLGQRQDVADLYQAFDLFVQSSEYEGTPNAVLEAMAMEVPIVATDVGGTRELAAPDVHARIVPRYDVPALRNAIQGALTDPGGARQRAVAARRRVETDLSFDARTRRLESIYESLAQSRLGRRR